MITIKRAELQCTIRNISLQVAIVTSRCKKCTGDAIALLVEDGDRGSSVGFVNKLNFIFSGEVWKLELIGCFRKSKGLSVGRAERKSVIFYRIFYKQSNKRITFHSCFDIGVKYMQHD